MTNTTLSKDTLAKVIYLKGTLKLVSPLTLGNGNDSSTDKDFSTDYDGKPFIPATALAGSVSHFFEKYISDEKDKEIFQKLFGTFRKDNESIQSNVTFYDLPATKYHTEIRDGIKVDYATKITESTAKYDYEILSYNSEFYFRMKIIIRKEDNGNIKKIKTILQSMIDNINEGNIRLGAKTSRGFGKLQFDNLKYELFDLINDKDEVIKDNINKFIDFSWNNKENFQNDISNLSKEKLALNFNKTTVKLDFEIPYSIMIKKVDYDLNGVDAMHLSSKDNSDNTDKYVIPATSWVGAINTSIYNISEILDKKEEIKNIKKALFGDVDEKNKTAQVSRIRIEESIITGAGAKLIKYTRNAIDRFTGGTVNSALFTEKALYSGRVSLQFHIIDPQNYELELLHLALRDFCNGIQSIGGETNIGRGILEVKKEAWGDIQVDNYKNLLAELNKNNTEEEKNA